jgi:hypothetical protein
MSRSNLSRDDLEDILDRFATNLHDIRIVLRSISDAAGTVAEAIEQNLDALSQIDAQAKTDAAQGEQDGPPPRRVAEDLTMLLREHLTSFTTVTGRQPVEVAVTTEYREHLHAAAEEAAGYQLDPESIDRFWGLPVVVDDTIPEQPGFEIR